MSSTVSLVTCPERLVKERKKKKKNIKKLITKIKNCKTGSSRNIMYADVYNSLQVMRDAGFEFFMVLLF